MMLVTALLTGCTDTEEAARTTEAVKVDLAFSVSSVAQHTRMSDAIVQTNASQYRGMEEVHVVPFQVAGTVTVSDQPWIFMADELGTTYNKNNASFYYCHNCDFMPGTTSVLFYGHAPRTNADKTVNGSLQATMPARMAPADIIFRPDPIVSSEASLPEAQELADYLTYIASAEVTVDGVVVAWKNATHSLLRGSYLNFTNQQNAGVGVMAGSSANVRVYVNQLYQTVRAFSFAEGTTEALLQAEILRRIARHTTVTFDPESEEVTSLGTLDGFPASHHLPDGAAVLRWEVNAFQPQTVTSTVAAINTVTRYAYPAELYYFTNSRLRADSREDLERYYGSEDSWEKVLSQYQYDNATVSRNTRAVAIKNPIQYGVACLQVKLKKTATRLADAEGTLVNVGSGAFPMTAVIVGGQRKVGFDFKPTEPVSDADVCFVYDGEVKQNGTAYHCLSSTVEESAPTNTLLLQNAEGEEVKVVLEFENRSDTDFKGVDGVVYRGTKFYLVGSVKPSEVEANAPDYQKRVFTQDYITTLGMKVESLAKAYRVLPNLLQPRLELGIELTTQWVQAETTNVSLE